jgi:GcrA cell cycle regulator
MSWTDERIEALRTHWDAGLSASQIAEKLGEGVTRNAVIGKAHRLGLKSRPSPVKSEPAQAKAAKPKAKAKAKASGKVSLLELTERICKWPIGHPTDADFHFCGKPSKAGFPYCDEHCEVAYQAQAPRRDRPRPAMFNR